MSKDSLPQYIDPFRFAEYAKSIEGVLPIQEMDRLCTSLFSQDGVVEVKLAFGVDHHHDVVFLKGHVDASLVLQCQRCMQPFTFSIVNDFLSGIVTSEEEAKLLPEQYDPQVVTDNSLVIREVVEDELIVSLPIVPLHTSTDCAVAMPFAVAGSHIVEPKKDSPFKVIESLRTKDK